MFILITGFDFWKLGERAKNVEIRQLVTNVNLHRYDWWARMTRNNNNQALDLNAIVEEEKQLNWEDDIIDIKNDTDGASLTELTIMISNKIIPNTLKMKWKLISPLSAFKKKLDPSDIDRVRREHHE